MNLEEGIYCLKGGNCIKVFGAREDRKGNLNLFRRGFVRYVNQLFYLKAMRGIVIKY